jgi:hypothetical protein
MRTAQLRVDHTVVAKFELSFGEIEVDAQLPIDLGRKAVFDDFVLHQRECRKHESGDRRIPER